MKYEQGICFSEICQMSIWSAVWSILFPMCFSRSYSISLSVSSWTLLPAAIIKQSTTKQAQKPAHYPHQKKSSRNPGEGAADEHSQANAMPCNDWHPETIALALQGSLPLTTQFQVFRWGARYTESMFHLQAGASKANTTVFVNNDVPCQRS